MAQFILRKYDDLHWVGMVSELNKKEHDVKIKLMHPNYPSISYKWPIFLMTFVGFQKHILLDFRHQVHLQLLQGSTTLQKRM